MQSDRFSALKLLSHCVLQGLVIDVLRLQSALGPLSDPCPSFGEQQSKYTVPHSPDSDIVGCTVVATALDSCSDSIRGGNSNNTYM